MTLSPNKVYWYLQPLKNGDLRVGFLNRRGQWLGQRIFPAGSRTERLVPSLSLLRRRPFFPPSGLIVSPAQSTFSQIRLVSVVVNALAYAWGIRLSWTAAKTEPERGVKLWRLRWRKVLKPLYKK